MNDVVLIGLGRMGRAMAERYAAAGWSVRTWNRSGGGTAPTPRAAVGSGDGAVVLALFDDRACHEVLDQLGDAVAGRLVVNTSTVSVDGAASIDERIRAAGGRYVHAPVMGSLPAVLGGSLRVLAGGSQADVAHAGRALEPLATEVRHLGHPRDAAAAKLVANSSLAGAVLAVHHSLEAAAALGLPLSAALDVLEVGRLGEVVRGFRGRLEQPGSEAHFTVGALVKDVGLLGDTGIGNRLRARVDEGRLREHDDVTALALPTAYAMTGEAVAR
jgi:3-hydroxyisobutyrate dehydrogenase-like beta-hydroxyacid dehydrogenase